MGAVSPPHGGSSPKSVAETVGGAGWCRTAPGLVELPAGCAVVTAPTHWRWFCGPVTGHHGPAITPTALGDVALQEHSVPLSLHVFLVRVVVLPLNEVGLPGCVAGEGAGEGAGAFVPSLPRTPGSAPCAAAAAPAGSAELGSGAAGSRGATSPGAAAFAGSSCSVRLRCVTGALPLPSMSLRFAMRSSRSLLL